MLQNRDLIVYTLLAIFLFVGLFLIFKKKKLGNEQKVSKDEKNTQQDIEQIEALNSIIFLLHDLAKEYSNSGYEKKEVEDYIGKIVISKSWEERLNNLPKTNEEDVRE